MKQWLKAGVLFLLITSTSFSQEKLTLEQALAIALKNNFDIQIERNNEKRSDQDVVKERSNFLPTIGVSGQVTTLKEEESKTNFQTGKKAGTITQSYDSFSGGLNASLDIGSVYDAVKSYVSAINSNEQSKESVKSRIQSVLMEVTRNYYDLLRQKNLLRVSEQSVETSAKQVERSESKYEIGSVAKKDVFSAKVQLNRAKSSLFDQKLSYERAKNTLNISLGNNAFDEIDVFDNVQIENKYSDYKSLEAQLLKNNPELKAEELGIKNAQIGVDRNFARMYVPTFGVGASYRKNASGESNFSDVISSVQDNYRASAYLSISFNLFNGFSDQANLEQAEIALHNAELNRKKKIQGLTAELYQAYITLQNRIEKLKLQEENLVASQEDYRLAQERFNIGSGTSLELKEAQDGVVEAESNLVSAKFDAKISEVNIDRLLGTIKID